jgi:hypothetical protein
MSFVASSSIQVGNVLVVKCTVTETVTERASWRHFECQAWPRLVESGWECVHPNPAAFAGMSWSALRRDHGIHALTPG